MKGKMFKKTLSCLLAIMMVVASVPVAGITAQAASTLTNSSRTVLCAGSEDRLKDSNGTPTLQITNDGQPQNFSWAVWQYDISSLKNTVISQSQKIDTANVTYTVKNLASEAASPELSFYYSASLNEAVDTSTRTNVNAFVTDISQRSTDESVGGTYRADCLTSWYDLRKVDTKTTSQLKTGSVTVNFADALNDALYRGLDYFTVFALQAKRPNTDRNNRWSDINITNNQYDISYSASNCSYTTSTLNLSSSDKKGVLVNMNHSNYSRWTSGNVATLANDKQNANCTIGFFTFDVSSISSADDIVSAMYKFKNSLGSDTTKNENMGITVSYATKNLDSFNNSGENAISSITYDGTNKLYSSGDTDTNNDFIAHATTCFGLQKLNSYATANGDSSKERLLDIAPAIKWAKKNGNKVVVTFMLSNSAGYNQQSTQDTTNRGAWSDVSLDLSNSSISVIRKITTYATPSNVNTEIKSKIDKGAYTGNASRAADGSYTKSGLTGGDEMSNVLWTYGVSGSSAYKEKGNDSWYNAGIQFGAITFLYDGTNKMACPINFSVIRTGTTFNSGYNQKPHSMYAASTNYIQLNHKWHGTSTSATYQTSTDYSVNTVNAHQVSTPKSKDLTYKDEYNYYSNSIYMKTGYLSFSSNLMTISNTDWHIYVADDNKSETSGFDASFNTSGNANGDMAIRIINYKPIKDAMAEIKSFYNSNVYQQENYYTAASLSEYYDAISKVCIDPNSYFDTSSTSGNNYTACQNAVTTAINAIDTAKGKNLKKRTVNVTYKFLDGTETVLQASAGVTPTDIAHSSFTSYSNITDTTHTAKVYGWDNLSDKLLNDTTINETSSVLDSVYHDFNNKTECECGSTIDVSVYATEKYNAANLYAQGDTSGYTVDSIASYYDIVKELVKDNDALRNNVHSQTELDEIVVQMLYARATLTKIKSTVTLKVYDVNNNNAEISDAEQEYVDCERNATLTVEPKTKHNVVKWVVSTNNTRYTTVGEKSSIDYVVTGDATIEAYCDDTTLDDAASAYTKVIFKGSDGNIVAIKYLKDGQKLDTSEITKPSIPMYTTGDWNVQEVVGSADKKVITVTAPCTPNSSYKCTVHFPGGQTIDCDYDERVNISDYIDTNNVSLALATRFSKESEDIIAYVTGTVFHAPARSDVYVVKLDKGATETKINTFGVYSTVVGGKKKIGFNNKLSLAPGCKAVEWGIVFIAVKTDGSITSSTIMPVKKLSPENEFTAIVSVAETNNTYRSIRAKAYMKYTDSTGAENTVYGDEYTQAFTTDTTIGGTKL